MFLRGDSAVLLFSLEGAWSYEESDDQPEVITNRRGAERCKVVDTSKLRTSGTVHAMHPPT